MNCGNSLLESLAGRLNQDFAELAIHERLRRLRDAASGRIVFTTSFGLEDQALTHLLAGGGIEVELATLDTGRLFPEVYGVWAETEERYGLRVRAFYPERDALEALVSDQGVNGFYGSISMRKACCAIRKLEPLSRALADASLWLTGLRADQSESRQELAFVSFDPARALLKANPLLDWTRERTLAFVQANAIPMNPLHDKGFLSIGCAPCTRAVQPGETERAGRWWWEREGDKECGLHTDAHGRLKRARPEANHEGAAP